MSRTTRRAHSDATKALLREKGLARGKRGAGALDDAATSMMSTIEKEMSSNNGIYPRNGGALVLAEFSRRLMLDESTIRKNHKSLAARINEWIAKQAHQSATTRTAARRTEAERASEWKALYLNLLASYHIHELDWQEMAAELADTKGALELHQTLLDELKTHLHELDEENARLRAALGEATEGKVVSLRGHQPSKFSPPTSDS